MRERIQIGDQVYPNDGADPVGAVRDIARDGSWLVLYVENFGDFTVSTDAVTAVHAQKVVLALDRLEPRVRDAIAHAHDAEEPGL
jgi:hypothetical protein